MLEYQLFSIFPSDSALSFLRRLSDTVTEFNKFFSPESVVIMGASNDPKKWGYRILANLVFGGFQGRIYAINPNRDKILGKKVYKNVSDIPEIPDLAVIVVPPVSIVNTIRDCTEKGIKAGVVITAGFAEIGERGKALQTEMLEVARIGGMRLIGPNCFGILSPSHKLYSQMPPIFPPEGPVAVVSQSGNVGISIARRVMALKFGISRLISIGNEADLHSDDFLEFLDNDDKTKVILSYIEGFKNGRRFFEVAHEITRRKPVVMIKAGETEAGASAARSHTAALSGNDNAFDGVCRQAGIIRVHNINALLNVGFGLLCNPLPRGRRVGIAALGGGWGVLAADACAKLGLQVVKLSEDVLKELDSFLPAWWSRNNPVDTVAGDSKLQLRVIDVLARYEQTDSIVALMLPTPEAAMWMKPANEEQRKQRDQIIIDHYERVFREIKGISKKYGKPVIVAADIMLPSSTVDLDSEIKSIVAANESVYYGMPDEAAMVLDALARYGEYLNRA